VGRLFGSRETQNERLLRELQEREGQPDVEPGPVEADTAAGDVAARPADRLPTEWPVAPSITGVPEAPVDPAQRRLAGWRPLATVQAPELAGSEIHFYALVDGSVIVDEQEGDAPLDPLLDGLEGQLELPYRARAILLGEGRWSVGAEPIAVVELPGVEPDDLTIGVVDGEFHIEGPPIDDPALLDPIWDLAADRGYENYAVDASRLEDATFAVVLTPL
jgi:hypothetical protein